jgi:hypothetical protein
MNVPVAEHSKILHDQFQQRASPLGAVDDDTGIGLVA